MIDMVVVKISAGGMRPGVGRCARVQRPDFEDVAGLENLLECVGGLGRIEENQDYPVFDEREGRELVQRVRVYLPSRTALVLEREML